MVPFTYTQAQNVSSAVASQANHRSDGAAALGANFFAGGSDMMQLMQERVCNPSSIVDITALPDLNRIDFNERGARLGALVRMSDAATHAGVLEYFPVVAQALLASASPQVRNVATLGGNLLQRTRCGYFRDVVMPCNKREPGTGCPAIDGQNRLLAILGTSEHCMATYAGDFANALLVLDAAVRIAGPHGERVVALSDLHRLPGDTPQLETQLHPGELIVSVDIPFSAAGRRSYYLKVRDRTSFAFALASVAVALELDGDGIVRDVRLAVGGVATRPWRLPQVEHRLLRKRLTVALCREAALSATERSKARGQNAYKIVLLQRTVARGLEETGGLA